MNNSNSAPGAGGAPNTTYFPNTSRGGQSRSLRVETALTRPTPFPQAKRNPIVAGCCDWHDKCMYKNGRGNSKSNIRSHSETTCDGDQETRRVG